MRRGFFPAVFLFAVVRVQPDTQRRGRGKLNEL